VRERGAEASKSSLGARDAQVLHLATTVATLHRRVFGTEPFATLGTLEELFVVVTGGGI
jgi:hypothetical protein